MQKTKPDPTKVNFKQENNTHNKEKIGRKTTN